MPYANPKDRDYKHEWELEKKDPKRLARRAIRQQARQKLDAAGVDRKGKDIDHKTPLSKSTVNANAGGNLRLVDPEVNRAFSQKKGKTVKNANPGSRKVNK